MSSHDGCVSCGAEVDHYLGCPGDPNPDYEAEAEAALRHSHDPFDAPFADYWAARTLTTAGEVLAREAFAAGALWQLGEAQMTCACYDPWHTPAAHGKAFAVDAEDLPEPVKVAALQAARDVRDDDWDDTWDETALAVLGAVWHFARTGGVL